MSGARVHLALLDAAGGSLLWRSAPGGWALPSVEIDGSYPAQVEEAQAALAALGFAVTILRTPIVLLGEDDDRSDIVQLAEPIASLPSGYRWRPLPPLTSFVSGPSERRTDLHGALRQALADERDPPPQRPPWARRGWRTEAEAWLVERLHALGRPPLGPMVQLKQWSLTSLWRVPTAAGDAYFKVAPPLPLFCDEGAVVRLLASRWPGWVPEVLAHDAERRWLLLASFTGRVASGAGSEELLRVARAYASLQVGAAEQREALRAIGAIDRGRGSFERHLDHLLFAAEERSLLTVEERSRLPDLRPKALAAFEELSDLGLPDSLVHGDLHLGNVALLDGGQPLFFDWTDAAVGQPFVDLVTLLDFPEQPGDERFTALKRAYLEPWRDHLPQEQLWRAGELGILLGFVHQAVSYQGITEATEVGARWELAGMTALCLRRLLALL